MPLLRSYAAISIYTSRDKRRNASERETTPLWLIDIPVTSLMWICLSTVWLCDANMYVSELCFHVVRRAVPISDATHEIVETSIASRTNAPMFKSDRSTGAVFVTTALYVAPSQSLQGVSRS